MIDYIQQQFVNYLVQEVKSKSNFSDNDARREVYEFSKTKEFKVGMKKWWLVNKAKYKRKDTTRKLTATHISELLK